MGLLWDERVALFFLAINLYISIGYFGQTLMSRGGLPKKGKEGRFTLNIWH
jgi:hypothetical protein